MRSADSIAFSFSSRRVGIDRPASYLLQQQQQQHQQQPATYAIATTTAATQQCTKYPMYTKSAVHVATTS